MTMWQDECPASSAVIAVVVGAIPTAASTQLT